MRLIAIDSEICLGLTSEDVQDLLLQKRGATLLLEDLHFVEVKWERLEWVSNEIPPSPAFYPSDLNGEDGESPSNMRSKSKELERKTSNIYANLEAMTQIGFSDAMRGPVSYEDLARPFP